MRQSGALPFRLAFPLGLIFCQRGTAVICCNEQPFFTQQREIMMSSMTTGPGWKCIYVLCRMLLFAALRLLFLHPVKQSLNFHSGYSAMCCCQCNMRGVSVGWCFPSLSIKFVNHIFFLKKAIIFFCVDLQCFASRSATNHNIQRLLTLIVPFFYSFP